MKAQARCPPAPQTRCLCYASIDQPPREKSVEQSAIEPGVGINAPVAQEWPVRPMLVDAAPIDVGQQNFFCIARSFGNDFAVRPANEALPPELNASATAVRFVADA